MIAYTKYNQFEQNPTHTHISNIDIKTIRKTWSVMANAWTGKQSSYRIDLVQGYFNCIHWHTGGFFFNNQHLILIVKFLN